MYQHWKPWFITDLIYNSSSVIKQTKITFNDDDDKNKSMLQANTNRKSHEYAVRNILIRLDHSHVLTKYSWLVTINQSLCWRVYIYVDTHYCRHPYSPGIRFCRVSQSMKISLDQHSVWSRNYHGILVYRHSIAGGVKNKTCVALCSPEMAVGPSILGIW